MNGLGRDLRHAVRGLRKNPAFTLVVVLTLGLGIGANAAIFSLMDQVLFRALPVHDPARLVLLDGPGPFRGRTVNNMTFSYPMYVDFREKTETFSGVLARFQMSMTVGWKGQAERADGDLVSGNYFEVLGVKPALGRVFNSTDDTTPGAHPVVVISYGYWQRRFGGDPSILNQPISVNGHPFTIVGVSGPGFNGIQVGIRSDVMVPMMMKAAMKSLGQRDGASQARHYTCSGRSTDERRLPAGQRAGDPRAREHDGVFAETVRGEAPRGDARRPWPV
jgi:hypothetical protein